MVSKELQNEVNLFIYETQQSIPVERTPEELYFWLTLINLSNRLFERHTKDRNLSRIFDEQLAFMRIRYRDLFVEENAFSLELINRCYEFFHKFLSEHDYLNAQKRH